MRERLRKVAIVALLLVLATMVAHAEEDDSPESFRRNLKTMLEKTEKSIQILREQISNNQSAPFAPDLYLQLGELLSQKASTFYYIQMEREDRADASTKATQQFSAVTEAQKEAIEIFDRLIKDFPRYEKRSKVLYLLAVSLKSIDEVPRFIGVVGQLIKQFPRSEETMRARLLLGQHWADGGNNKEAMEILAPVLQFKSPFERNMARYRVALIYLANEKPKESFRLFEEIILDKELREGDAPSEVSLKTKTVKSNLKREALLDSVRAYTTVFPDNGDAITYYSRIAPNEVLFYETIEKLAFRYINLKKYEVAIKLLRALSQRTNDPQKVVTIYREVLSIIPPKDRVDIPASEVRVVLQRYSQWLNFYDVPKDVYSQSAVFFERQVRDLGTRSQEMAQTSADPKLKAKYFTRARDFYLLYLAFFKRARAASKIGVNLANTYYSMGRYPESADFYLRAFQEEFGKQENKTDLIENALTSAQKEGNFSFYEQLRTKGLLLRAIRAYFAFSPKMKSDARLTFLYVKTRYEQGNHDEAIEQFYAFMRKHRDSKYAVDAGDIVLDHYNTRKDFNGLATSTAKIQEIGIKNASFSQRVAKIKEAAAIKKLDETVKANSGGDPFSQGKNYLQTALSLNDDGLKDTALRVALAKSKEERDLETFFKTATVLASQEKNPAKKAEIQRSIAKENLRITRFYQGLSGLQAIYDGNGIGQQDKLRAFEEAVEVGLLLRDWKLVGKLVRNPLWAQISVSLKEKTRSQLSDLAEAPLTFPSELAPILLSGDSSDAAVLSLFKARGRASSDATSKAGQRAGSLCQGGRDSTLCKWVKATALEEERARFLPSMRGPASVASVEEKAKGLASLTEKYGALEGSGDLQLDMVLSLRNFELLRGFSEYLKSAAASAPNLASVLNQKAAESVTGAKAALARCRELATKSGLYTSTNRFCKTGESAGIGKLLEWGTVDSPMLVSRDPDSSDAASAQKSIFSGGENGDALLKASDTYLSDGNFPHAAASAQIGLSSYPDREGDFRAVLGCALSNMKLLNEASFHLKKASSYNGLAGKCSKQLESRAT